MVAENFASVRMQRFHSLTWLHIAFRAARTVGRWSISWSDQYVNLQREGTVTTIPRSWSLCQNVRVAAETHCAMGPHTYPANGGGFRVIQLSPFPQLSLRPSSQSSYSPRQ
jgi:hypothetical protein